MWVAAWLRSYPISRQLIEREYLYANTTENRVPFSDLYSTISGRQVGFQARPVQGGILALLALQALAARRSGEGRRSAGPGPGPGAARAAAGPGPPPCARRRSCWASAVP